MIGELLDGQIGAVDLDVGASVSVDSLGHQLFDSSQGGLSALSQFRSLRFGSFDTRSDDLGPRGEAYDHADALERRAIRFVDQHSSSRRNHFRKRPVAMGASPAIARQVRDRFAFEPAKVRLAMVCENLRDWFSSARDDDHVEVHEFPSKPARDQRTDRAFAGSHESGEDQFGRHIGCRANQGARVFAAGALAVSVVANLFEEAFEVALNLRQ